MKKVFGVVLASALVLSAAFSVSTVISTESGVSNSSNDALMAGKAEFGV
ncbi:hypothetical protein P4637_14105 [Halalkalibacterium halodurans]|uniref:BH1988 protein n=1 Tax=Halalkalibacterium halodurans (strain ATCC BAA-125 / DSM 18197 / FERM 7344 / JCM 9153 / C-125) TaxID=272558 RepID=Q9KBE0_HALH5|nr:hypothetical protein [Halalkalibacterium halodurans]MDY7222548.1 hypothetical protein [Halalkalibacterium halodurans]MDY7241769.1 hypothetical protein [Halalkalibacterium halodurans]MED4082608.1 hypothetical protein [Halalkalibacterium halodurans]MED4085938.1 hypothetical protein [Halalkalibacterium halodurans]MED4104032.1 hypothetical protein [Halalkalibacterium halodurans]